MKTSFQHLFLFLLCLVIHDASSQIKIKLVSDVWPPFTNEEGKRAVAQDIVREALKRNGYQVVPFINNDFNASLLDLQNDTYDGSSALWKDDERSNYLLFSRAFLKNQLILVGRKNSGISQQKISELQDKKIAVVRSYSYGEISTNESIELIYGNSDQENLQKLINEEVDFMLVDALLIEYLLSYQKSDVQKYLEIGSEIVLEKELYFGLRKNFPDAEKIISNFNTTIIEMLKDGTYNRILNINWIKADVDGDGTLELISSEEMNPAFSQTGYAVPFGNTSQGTIGGYYMGGNSYDNWKEIPKDYQYKDVKDPTGEFKILDFKF